MDDERDDERTPGDWGTQADPGALHVPQMTPAAEETPASPTPTPPAAEPGGGAAPAAEPSGAALLAADITAAWAKLDQGAKLLVNASVAAIILTIVGLPLSVWDSAPFALLVMTAGVITVVTAWFGAHPAMRSMPIPRPTIELVATSVAAILAIMKALELVFDLDSGTIIPLVVAIALAAASVVMVIAAERRGANLRGALTRRDQGSMIAVAGLALVLLGWAFNLSISFWTMGQAALPLAVLTIAALTIAEGPRIQSPVPVAWVGAGIAVFGALLAMGNWNELTTLGRTDLELDPADFLGITAYTAGTALIIAGGILSGRSQWTPRPTVTESAPTTDSEEGPTFKA